MKKIFVLLFAVALLAFAGCSKQTVQTNPDPPGAKVEYVIEQPAIQAMIPVLTLSNVRDVTGERLQSYSSYSKSNADVILVQDLPEQPPGEGDKTFWQLVLDNWGSLLLGLLGFVELLIRLTPSDKDNSILNMILKFLNVILPNLKKGGGKFEVRTE